MDNVEKYFVYLISCFLNSTKPTKSTDAWSKLFRLAEINNVTGVVANEIMQLSVDMKPQGTAKSYFNQSLGRTLQRYEETNDVLERVEAFLNDNNIEYSLVKGACVRNFYPSPALRTSGDIDVVIREEQYDRLLELVHSSELEVETGNPRVIVVIINDIPVELHNGADVHGSYYDGRIFDISTKQGNKYVLDEYDSLMYVVLHLVKHLKCRGAGIRMLMDVDVCVRGINNFDEDKFIKMCCDAGIEKCGKMLFSLCNFWFSTPVTDYFNLESNEDLVELLSNTFLHGGIFGFEINDLGSHYVAQNAGEKVDFKAKLKAFSKWVFPSVSSVKRMYFYSEKHSCLIPIAYLQRFFEGVFKRGVHSVKTAKQIANSDDTVLIETQILNELDIF